MSEGSGASQTIRRPRADFFRAQSAGRVDRCRRQEMTDFWRFYDSSVFERGQKTRACRRTSRGGGFSAVPGAGRI